MRKLNISALLFFLGIGLFAQQLNLPDDPELAAEAKRRFVISVDEMNLERYDKAVQAIQWIDKKVPLLNDGVYINGYKAYEELANATDDETKKNLYLDSMFYFYDMKGEHFELTDREKNNKAYRYYKYWKSNKDRLGDAINAYKAAYENPEQVINNNVVSYMDIVRRYKAYGNPISTNEILEAYSKVTEVIGIKRAQGEDGNKLDQYANIVNSLFTEAVGDEIDCDFIDQNLAKPLDNEEDVTLAKKVFGLLLGQSCSDSPYFLKSALIIQKNEPTSGLAKVIAQQYYKMEDMDNASAYYQQAIGFESDAGKKAALYMDLAKLYAAQGLKIESRQFAMEAAKADAGSSSEAYTFIGNLYMGSYEDCKKGQSQIDDRAVFMAAYDMFQKAADQYGMSQAKAQFPTVSDVFTANKEEGQSIKVGCWMNVTTTIRTRPSE